MMRMSRCPGVQSHEAVWFRHGIKTNILERAGRHNRIMTWMQQIFGQSVQFSHLATTSLAGYVLGCLTTGYYLVRFWLHQDIRDTGSGSVGARNAARVLGMPGFLVT